MFKKNHPQGGSFLIFATLPQVDFFDVLNEV